MTDCLKPKNIDKLQLYFRQAYSIDNFGTIYQPTVGDIMEFGEQRFFNMLNVFIGNTTMFRLQLWKNGIDWNKITDYQLFCGLIASVEPNDSYILFGDIDFSQFEDGWTITRENGETVPALVNNEQQLYIDEEIYVNIAHYLRTMFNIFPKNEWARGKATKEAIIWEDEENYKKNKDKTYRSHLLPLISACVNHPGFKYKSNELKEIGIFEFMDSVQRLQIYESTSALLKGRYSGFVDTSNIDNEEFNFMRDLYKESSEN